ncbi:alpha-2,8-sialyltransferase 8E-like [Leptodactylus fuscus]
MTRCRHLVLIPVLLLTCFIFYQNLQHRVRNSHGSRREHKKLPEAECLYLKSVILKSIRNTWDNSQFLAVTDALQGCPWKANQTARDLRQSQFIQCCNASYTLLVTQENSPVGHIIKYDGEDATKNVTESLHVLFPKYLL